MGHGGLTWMSQQHSFLHKYGLTCEERKKQQGCIKMLHGARCTLATPGPWRTRSSSMHVQPMTSCIVCCACKVLDQMHVFKHSVSRKQMCSLGGSRHLATEHHCDREMFHRGRMLKVTLIKGNKKRKQGPWVIL